MSHTYVGRHRMLAANGRHRAQSCLRDVFASVLGGWR